jgi:hypothetical protein
MIHNIYTRESEQAYYLHISGLWDARWGVGWDQVEFACTCIDRGLHDLNLSLDAINTRLSCQLSQMQGTRWSFKSISDQISKKGVRLLLTTFNNCE